MFKYCDPDANTFDSVVKFKNFEDIDKEYIKLDNDIGYWIFDTPFLDNQSFHKFRSTVSNFPICKNNNLDSNNDPNPFDTIHIPAWLHKDICFILRDFYLCEINNQIQDPTIFEWGNIFFSKNSRPIKAYRIPHRDYDNGIVGNLWFTNHKKRTSGTKFYKYMGNNINGEYEFVVNPSHKCYDDYQDLLKQGRNSKWFNFDDSELHRWGFEYLGMADSIENTMTVYKSNICHLAYIEDEVKFRWSHTFAFAHR